MTESERQEFEAIVEKEFLKLPDWVRKKIQNVAVLIEDEPSREIRKEEALLPDETLLGYYRGFPRSARGSDYGVGPTMPDTITLYRTPILEEARNNAKEVERVVKETIWHEFAHYFGMDEDAVRNREKKRDRDVG